MNFNQLRRLAWDTETTSVSPTEARIVTAALVVRGGGLPFYRTGVRRCWTCGESSAGDAIGHTTTTTPGDS